MDLKKLFDEAENGVLNYDQFSTAVKESGVKLADLSEGNYVSVGKYNSDIGAKTKEIETLSSTISTRDTDLQSLQEQLKAAGADTEKLEELTKSLTDLQSKYDNDTKAYKAQLKKQAYEFAVKEFTNSQKFSSSAAKRDFERSLLDKDLKMEKGKILGADDFVATYKEDNADAFLTEPTESESSLPEFSQGIENQGTNNGVDTGFQFNFTGVR